VALRIKIIKFIHIQCFVFEYEHGQNQMHNLPKLLRYDWLIFIFKFNRRFRFVGCTSLFTTSIKFKKVQK